MEGRQLVGIYIFELNKRKLLLSEKLEICG